MRWGRVALAVALGTALPAGLVAETRSAAAPGCEGVTTEEVLVGAGPEGELRFASGRAVRLADLRLPDGIGGAGGGEGSASLGAAAWLRSLAGERVRVRSVGTADRWGREPAAVALGSATAPIDIAELLVSEGLATVDAGEQDALCRPELLASESAARRARRGLWRDGTLPLAAGDRAGVRARAGRFAVIEGRVVSVGERPGRTYLNFGRDFAQDLAVVVPRRTWAALRRKGMSAAALTGRRVRVRGTVELWRGPVMEIAVPDMLEAVAEAGDGRP